MSKQSNSAIDLSLEARQQYGRAQACLKYLDPYMDRMTKELITKLAMATRDKTLTDGSIRSIASEIAGIYFLRDRIDSDVRLSRAKMETPNG